MPTRAESDAGQRLDERHKGKISLSREFRIPNGAQPHKKSASPRIYTNVKSGKVGLVIERGTAQY